MLGTAVRHDPTTEARPELSHDADYSSKVTYVME